MSEKSPPLYVSDTPAIACKELTIISELLEDADDDLDSVYASPDCQKALASARRCIERVRRQLNRWNPPVNPYE
jgi:hypothetical protein